MILFFFSNSNAPNAISIISTNTAQAAQSEKQNVLSATRNGVISKALEAERSEGGKSIQEKEREPRGDQGKYRKGENGQLCNQVKSWELRPFLN